MRECVIQIKDKECNKTILKLPEPLECLKSWKNGSGHFKGQINSLLIRSRERTHNQQIIPGNIRSEENVVVVEQWSKQIGKTAKVKD